MSLQSTQSTYTFFLIQVKSYIDLAEKEGGKILCGENVDSPLELPKEYAEVSKNTNIV